MDNGAMENFFGRLKVEMFCGEKFESINAFIDDKMLIELERVIFNCKVKALMLHIVIMCHKCFVNFVMMFWLIQSRLLYIRFR